MTAELFIPPSKALDANANPYSGAKWYFYLTGTLTAEAVFTTSARDTEHSNPVIADSSGKFADIYFNTSVTYRAILKNADDSVELYDIDPVNTGLFSLFASPGGAALIGPSIRDAATAAIVAANTNGSVVELSGLSYEVDSTKTGSNSATNDLGVDGLIPFGTVTPQHFGTTDGVADCVPVIQRAIDYLVTIGGGILFFPRGTYLCQTEIEWKSNVHYSGENKASVLKINATPGPDYMFNQASDDLDNVTFDGLAFDGSLNYPADSTVYKATMAARNTAIRAGSVTVTNLKITNCHFESWPNSSIDINGFSSKKILIDNNTFNQGGYIYKTIGLRIPSDTYTDAQMISEIIISRNNINLSGPQLHYDPSKEDWTASADAIQLDSAKDSIISDNVIDKVGGIGVRIEESFRVSVTGNRIIEPGQEGITFYKNSEDCSCENNSIINWGRIPFVYGIRSYGGANLVARETPKATGPVLPADPSASAYFDTWPYSVDGVDVASIIAYSTTDYYTGSSAGILPFRGYSAISVTNQSKKISITNNVIMGNSDVDGSSKLEHACDFGISMTHSVNDPTVTGLDCVISGNIITGAQQHDIYHPEYHDPIAGVSLLGSAVYNSNVAPTSLIHYSNKLDGSVRGTYVATLTTDSGTITLGNQTLNYTKIGRLCTVSGEITVSAISSPTGSVNLNLPFTGSESTLHRSAHVSSYVRFAALTGSPSGSGILSMGGSATQAELSIENNFVVAGVVSNIQVNTIIIFNFTYQTA